MSSTWPIRPSGTSASRRPRVSSSRYTASVNGGAFDAWLIKIQVDPADVEALLDRAAYVALTGGEA